MRQIRRSGLATLMVTGGALALTAGYAHADSAAEGAAVGSPGVGSGNTVQLPVHVPVNVCGNTVNVVGALNPAAGNRCANGSGGSDAASGSQGAGSHKDQPGTPRAGGGRNGGGANGGSHAGGTNGGGTNGGGSSNSGGATAEGIAKGSPGVLSGNLVQLPVHLPVNVSGNSVNVVGIGNPAFGNTSTNGPLTPEHPEPNPPGKPAAPAPGESVAEPPAHAPQADSVALAETGANIAGYGIPASAALLLGGAILYRRSRSAGVRA
ncbi:chaplin [Streptomyces sp. NPDC048629]|uniref:chaplin n=1 Tax=Streptomyces sp. NPDC048629 TaxID=3154824 RepID=UPI00342C72D1